MKLKNKTALVTGASRGIGAAIALRLAAEGAKVVITYNGSKAAADAVVEAIRKNDGQAIAVQADAANAVAVENAVAETVKKFGSLDILVNNAGLGLMGAIEDFSLENFDKLMAVNVRGVFVATQAAVKHMKPGSRVIQIGSVNAERVPFAGASVYSMSKAAVAGFTQGLARDLGPKGITVNNVQPGPIDTDMNPANSEFAQSLLGTLALGRYGKVEEVANFVAFLAGPDSSYITGANLSVDGGFLA